MPNPASLLTKEQVLAALDTMITSGEPLRKLRDYFIDYQGMKFPPKDVVRKAIELASLGPIEEAAFYGGADTNNPLEQLGFTIGSLKETSITVNKHLDVIALDGRKLYKMSHGIFVKDRMLSQLGGSEYFKKKNWIVLNQYTGKGQADNFKSSLQIDDYVYICYGGDSVSTFGRVISKWKPLPPEAIQYVDGNDEWIYREIEPLFEPVKPLLSNLKSSREFWLPSGNSTFYPVETANLDFINQHIFIPNYGLKVLPLSFTSEELVDESVNLQPMALNQIFYGPPGTGKTFTMQGLFREFADAPKAATTEEEQALWLKEATWWEVLAHVLYHLPAGTTVPQLKQHPLIKAKFAQSEIKNTSQRLWGTLQHHTVAECKNVLLERRLSPPIFWKEEASLWRLADREEFAAEFPELVTGPVASAAQSVEVKRYKFTTAHQSWSYEDFVEGIKPRLSREAESDDAADSHIGYHHKDGLFYEACDEAARLAGFNNLQDCLKGSKEERTERFSAAPKYALFIDEINRANISAVFGELITLIEDDKRLGAEYEISDTQLPYSRRRFGIPPNLHIIGTMNTADRSVEALDTALRRRFSFIEKPPLPEKLREDVEGINLQELLSTINHRLSILLDSDRTIGHAWLLGAESIEDLRTVFAGKIIPLLQEFFYNDLGKIGLVLGESFVESEKVQTATFAPFSAAREIADAYKGSIKYRIRPAADWDFTTIVSGAPKVAALSADTTGTPQL